jgi:hypothetical protein
MGSSSQRRLNGRSLALISRASRAVHGQLTSSVISTLSPAAFRASRTASIGTDPLGTALDGQSVRAHRRQVRAPGKEANVCSAFRQARAKVAPETSSTDYSYAHS